MYNQPPFNPSAPPATPPPSGSNKKVLFGVLGAVGCFGLLFAVALAFGGYYFYFRSKPTVANINVNSNNTSSPSNLNINSNSNTNSNTNTNGGTVGSGSSGLLRAKVQPKVGKFTLVKVETMTSTPPTSGFEVINSVNALLTRIISAASPTEAVYARYRDGSTDSYDGIDHRLVQAGSAAAAGSMMESVVTELKGMGFTERRRVPNTGQDRSTLGTKVYLQKGDGQYADEVVLWTNNSNFLSAVSGKGGNASLFETGTTY